MKEKIIAPVADNAVAEQREKKVRHFMTHYNATKEQAEACVTILATINGMIATPRKLVPNKCFKCGGECEKGKTLTNGVALGTADECGSQTIYSGNPILVDCIKCQQCGHSFIHPFSKFFKDNG